MCRNGIRETQDRRSRPNACVQSGTYLVRFEDIVSFRFNELPENPGLGKRKILSAAPVLCSFYRQMPVASYKDEGRETLIFC